MSKNLVALLRRPYGNLTFAEKQEVADLIEELEDQLAKAVEALVRIADIPSEMTWGVDSEVREAMNGMEIIAETTLAELKGQDDE